MGLMIQPNCIQDHIANVTIPACDTSPPKSKASVHLLGPVSDKSEILETITLWDSLSVKEPWVEAA